MLFLPGLGNTLPVLLPIEYLPVVRLVRSGRTMQPAVLKQQQLSTEHFLRDNKYPMPLPLKRILWRLLLLRF